MKNTRSFYPKSAVVLALCLAAVAGTGHAQDSAQFAAPIEKAHGASQWHAQKGFEADLQASLGGQTFGGKLVFKPDMGASRFELTGGPVLVYDGQDAWVSPAAAQFPGARFHLLTWPYFIALPMKLSDPGARIEAIGERPLQGKPHPAARLTFAPGTGDTPEDWYILYREPGTNRLRAVAYIVTYGKSVEEAAKEPHALVYDEFQTLGGVTLATKWSLWNWNETEGLHGEPIGEARLTNLRFVDPPAELFTKPADSRKDELPQAAK